jgi:hypothetical protein
MPKHLATVIVVTFAIAGFAACGGDDDDSSASDAPDNTQVDASDESAPTNDSAPSEELSDLLERQNDAVIKVTYRRGDDEFTIAQDHEKRAITSGDTKVIATEDATINCSDLDTEPTCLDVPEGVDSLVNVGLSFYNVVAQSLATAADSVSGLETTQDEVAGRDATCAEADTNTFLSELTEGLGDVDLPSMSARVCVDNETGYLLEFSSDNNPTDNLIAIEVSEPSDSDFEPPVPLTDVPEGELPGDEPS